MMNKRSILLGVLALLAVAALGACAAWAISETSKLGGEWGSAWPFLLAGVVTVGVVIAGFLRLAYYSQSRGYDDRVDVDKR
jgi:hypothetical protein